MKPFVAWLAATALIISAAWWWLGRDDAPVIEPPVPPPVEEIEPEPEPLIRHPLPEPAPEPGPEPLDEPSPLEQALPDPLPDLDRSDAVLFSLVEFLVRNPELAELLAPRDLIRRFVVAIDSLGRDAMPLDRLPVTLPEGRFMSREENDTMTIDPRNYERYRHHVAFLDQLDTGDLAKTYIHLYPLFQAAWRELGQPPEFFNDRLIEVIDELLETPVIEDPIRVEQPSVWHVYADPEIEALTAGQRLLIRMGPDNASIVKRKLRELRAALVR